MGQSPGKRFEASAYSVEEARASLHNLVTFYYPGAKLYTTVERKKDGSSFKSERIHFYNGPQQKFIIKYDRKQVIVKHSDGRAENIHIYRAFVYL